MGRMVVLPKERLPAHLQTGFHSQYELAMDTNRIRTELGYGEPCSWADALGRTLEWEWSHPPEMQQTEQFNYAAEDAIVVRHRGCCRTGHAGG